MRKTLMAAMAATAALILAAAGTSALAYDDDGYSDAHSRFHQALEDAHERAHVEGFESSEEHRAFHHEDVIPRVSYRMAVESRRGIRSATRCRTELTKRATDQHRRGISKQGIP